MLVAGKWINNFARPELMWKVMALATTFAGNLIILGSAWPNIIVLEAARAHEEVGFLGLWALFRDSSHNPDNGSGHGGFDVDWLTRET